MMLQPQTLMTLFFVMIMLFGLMLLALYILSNWQEIRATMKGNCLIWRHPDKETESISKLELIKWDEAPGGYWPYSSFFFLPEKQIKWCYEVKDKSKEGEDIYIIKPFIPDNHINYSGVSSGELADALDWRPAKRLLQQKAPLLQKAAQGGVIIMGCAALFGIMALLDMLGKGG